MAKKETAVQPGVLVEWAELQNDENVAKFLDALYQSLDAGDDSGMIAAQTALTEAYLKANPLNVPASSGEKEERLMVAILDGEPVQGMRYVVQGQGRSKEQGEIEILLTKSPIVFRAALTAKDRKVQIERLSPRDCQVIALTGSDSWKAFVAAKHPVHVSAS